MSSQFSAYNEYLILHLSALISDEIIIGKTYTRIITVCRYISGTTPLLIVTTIG